ncbi:hypothetical protein GCM10028791_10060 [Echinicola sediminis]
MLELDRTETIPVIEAYWTDNRSFNQVRITQSKDYYDSSNFKTIKDAEVYVVHHERESTIDFQYSNQTGSYLPVKNITGRQGQHYSLHVIIGENHYRSDGVMLEAPTIDSLTCRYKEKSLLQSAGYFIKIHGKIPFERDNYYRARVIRNDTLLNRRDDYLLFDDTFGSSILEEGFELGIPFRHGDEARVALFRLNKSAYDYLQELLGLLFNDGGLFTPVPQNPPSNFEVVEGEGMVLGYFMVAPVLSRSLTIE